MSLAYVVNIARVAEQVDSRLTVKKDPLLHVGNGLGKLMAVDIPSGAPTMRQPMDHLQNCCWREEELPAAVLPR